MAHLIFYSYIAWHETTRKRPTVGTPPPTGDPAAAPEQNRVGHSSIARCLEELCCPMARGLQKTWLESAAAETHAGASTPLVDSAENEARKVSAERSDCGRVFNRSLDLGADSQSDRETFPCDLSPESCLATLARHGMEMSKTRTPRTPKERRSHSALDTARLATDKKKPQNLAPISYSWMKVGFCSSPMFGAPGLQEARHRTSTIGSSKIESLPLGLSAYLHSGDTPDFTCSSDRATSTMKMSSSSCCISLGTCEDRLCCCGIGEPSTVIIPSNRSLISIQDCIQSFSLRTRPNLTRRNTSGIEPTSLSLIASPTLSRICRVVCIRLHAGSELLRNVSSRVFMRVDCLEKNDSLFLYLCEAQ